MTRSDQGPRITARDIAALKWIAEQYAVCMDHLCILLARLRDPEAQPGAETKEEGTITDKRALKVVARWERLGLVERGWILHGQPLWVWCTAEGLRLVAQELGELRPHTPTPARITHLYYCNQARLIIEKRRPTAQWTSERIIRASQGKTEPGKTRQHLPDAIVSDNSRLMAVEIELSTKAYSRLDKILNEMAHTNYYTIWYFTLGRAEQVLQNALATIPQKDKFLIYRLEDMTL